MSNTFTSRPSYSQTQRGRGRANTTTRGRGASRGRGRGRGAVAGVMDGASGGTSDQQNNQQDQGADSGVQRGSGFTMFAPNERKRQAIAAQAKRETENYEKYKESRRLTYVTHSGTVGGESTCPAEAYKKTPVKKKTLAERRAEEKQREDAEYAKKKNTARAQAETNERKSADRNRRLDEERRRKNNAWLDKMEQKGKSPQKKSSNGGNDDWS